VLAWGQVLTSFCSIAKPKALSLHKTASTGAVCFLFCTLSGGQRAGGMSSSAQLCYVTFDSAHMAYHLVCMAWRVRQRCDDASFFAAK